MPAASHEDTSSDTPSLRCAEPIRLGHMTNSLFTLQSTPPPGSPRTVSLVFSKRRMVEVNGFEPMTSCLQSRRSPS